MIELFISLCILSVLSFAGCCWVIRTNKRILEPKKPKKLTVLIDSKLDEDFCENIVASNR